MVSGVLQPTLTLNVSRQQARFREQDVPLAQREAGVLEILMQHPGRVFQVEEALARLWDAGGQRSASLVAGYVMRVRRKLKKVGADGFLRTVHGTGYVMREQDAP